MFDPVMKAHMRQVRNERLAEEGCPDPGQSIPRFHAHREGVPITEFRERYGGQEWVEEAGQFMTNFYSTCPVCGSNDVDEESHPDMGGTSAGSAECGFCGYATWWCDLSAVI